MFSGLPNIRELHLSNNLIHEVQRASFKDNMAMTLLSLNGNKLEIIREHMFTGLSNLYTLSLYSNLIQRIEPGSFKDNTALTHLYLNDNALQTLPECIFGLQDHPQNLYRFSIYNNPLLCDQRICWLKWAEDEWVTVYRPDLTVCTAPGDLYSRTWDTITTQELKCMAPQRFFSAANFSPSQPLNWNFSHCRGLNFSQISCTQSSFMFSDNLMRSHLPKRLTGSWTCTCCTPLWPFTCSCISYLTSC